MTNDSIDRSFAGMVHDGRKALKLSQGELARRMAGWGFPFYQQTVRRIEEGRRKVSVGEAAALAVALRLDASLSELGEKLPKICPVCKDEPPPQFTCNVCGRSG
jgi:transcriptional regulator with XRE-family HTH domain